MVWGLSLAGGVGVVLGLEGSGVVHLVGLFVFFFLLCGVSRPRGPASPRYGRVFFFFFLFLALARFCLLLQKKSLLSIILINP